MKKLLLSSIICSILLWSCEKHPGKASLGYPAVERATALLMFKHYRDSTVIKNDLTIIQQTALSREDVLWALADKNTVRVQMQMAAYLDTDPNVTRRNQITMLLQLRKVKNKDTSYQYFDLKTEKQGIQMFVCPPPNQCDPEGTYVVPES